MQVEMTTGATIHTTEGLRMTVTRRARPPIIPELGVRVVNVTGDPEVNPPLVAGPVKEQAEVSTANP